MSPPSRSGAGDAMHGRDAGDVTAQYERGLACLEVDDFPAALEALQAVMQTLPGNEQGIRALLRLARRAGQVAMSLPIAATEARLLYESSLAAYLAMGGTISSELDRGLLHAVCFNLGAHFQGRKLYPEAIRHYQDAFLVDPESQDTPNNLAQVLIENGQPLEALAMLKPVIARHPNSAVLKHRRTQALKAAGSVS